MLKFGVLGHKVVDLSPHIASQTSLDVTLDEAYLVDFVSKAQRVRSRIDANLFDEDGLGSLCAIGGFRRHEQFWTKCTLDLVGNVDVLTRVGNLALPGNATFEHAGAKAGFELYWGKGTASGPFVTLGWIYLARLGGNRAVIPNIDQHTLAIGQRWWPTGALGVEVKAQWQSGIDPDALTHKDDLTLGFGLIF